LAHALPPDEGADIAQLLPAIGREQIGRLVPQELVDIIAIGAADILGPVIGQRAGELRRRVARTGERRAGRQ